MRSIDVVFVAALREQDATIARLQGERTRMLARIAADGADNAVPTPGVPPRPAQATADHASMLTSMQVQDNSVNLDSPDGAMRVYEARPEGTSRGAVIVVMEAFGVNAHIEDVTRRAAAAGYHAVAPDLFHRSGGGTADYGDMSRVRELFDGVTPDGVLTDIDAVLAHLRESGFGTSSIGITGFCWGGWVSFLTAVRRSLGASVTWYGGGIVSPSPLPFPPLIGEASTLGTPWLGLFGDRDEGIPPSDVETLRSTLDTAAEVPHEIVRYPDADHGFHCDGRPAVYNADAAADGWNRAMAWFGHYLA